MSLNGTDLGLSFYVYFWQEIKSIMGFKYLEIDIDHKKISFNTVYLTVFKFTSEHVRG